MPPVKSRLEKESVHELADYLRSGSSGGASASELADQFALPLPFVENVMASLREEARRAKKGGFKTPNIDLRHFATRVTIALRRAVSRPWIVIAVAALIVLLCLSTSLLAQQLGIERIQAIRSVESRLAGPVFFGMGGVMGFVCFVHFRRRIEWVAAGALTAAISPFLFLQMPYPEKPTLGWPVGLALSILPAFYFTAAGLFGICRVAGGYLHVRRRENELFALSRQEVLARYFDLQRRLERSTEADSATRTLYDRPSIQILRRHPALWAAAVAILGNAFTVGIIVGSNVKVEPAAQSVPPWWVTLASVSVSIFNVFFVVGLGIVADKYRHAIGYVVIFVLVGLLPYLLPFGPFGPTYVFRAPLLIGMLGNCLLFAIIACIGRLSIYVRNQAQRERRIEQNDPATLLAEMVRLQWHLEIEPKTICVMVIDAAKSSVMKAGADKMAVEFTFRQYQKWIETTVAEHGGKVHSTAGDGAVVAFTECEAAFRAAQQIQRTVAAFDHEHNQLQMPFRLRIGLHMGEVAGDLEDVEFTEVIDIAAHVEGVAQVGGIALSSPVAKMLSDERLAALTETVDGWHVFLAVNPTGE